MPLQYITIIKKKASFSYDLKIFYEIIEVFRSILILRHRFSYAFFKFVIDGTLHEKVHIHPSPAGCFLCHI